MYEPNVSSTMGTNGECEVTETNSTNWATVLSGMKSGDYLFVQFGINDGSTTCDRHVGSERYVTLLKRMGQAALDKGAHPIFLTPVSMIKCSGSSAVASRGFLTETKTAATALGVPMIDLHALSISLYNSLKFCPLPAGNTDISATTGGEVGAFFCEDHTHFDAPGALQIAGVIAKALRDQSIGLASYLK
jgi:lysophospholipase L1-like esterase